MQKLLSLVLSVSILVSSVSPAWSQARAAGRGITQGLRAMPVITRGVSPVLSGHLSRRVYTQIAFANSTVQARVAAGQIKGLTAYMLTRPEAERNLFLRKDLMVLSSIPNAVSAMEKSQVASLLCQQITAQQTIFKNIKFTDLPSFLTAYKQHPAQTQFMQVQGILSDAAALAQVGTSEHMQTLQHFYTQVQGSIFEDTAALITARAMLRTQSYDGLSRFLNQVSHKESLAGIAAYIRLKGLPITVPAVYDNLSIPAANDDLAAFLSTSSPLHLLHADPSVEATHQWLHFKPQLPQEVVQSPIAAHTPVAREHTPLSNQPEQIAVQEELAEVAGPAEITVEEPVTQQTQPPLSTQPPTAQAPVTVQTPASTANTGIVYSGVPVFAIIDAAKRAVAWMRNRFTQKQATPAQYEEPGLHDSNVRPILEKVDVPTQASIGGDLAGADSGVSEVSVGADGFKLTIENENSVEHILPNVDLTLSGDLKKFSTQFNRLVLDKNYIFKLRDHVISEEQPDHFYFVFSTQNGEFEYLIKGAEALKETNHQLRIKIQKPNPKKSITVPVYHHVNQVSHVVAEVDARLLRGVENPEKGRILWVRKEEGFYPQDLLLFQEENGEFRSLQNAFVRLPKAESRYWTQILKMFPQQHFHLTVLSTEGKMVPVTYLVPSLQVGLGKTLGPVLADMSTFGEDNASYTMLGINNVVPSLMLFVHPLLKRYGEAAVYRVGASLFSAGGLVALASGLYGHVAGGMMTPLQLTGFLTSSVLIALGTNVTRFVQNLLMSANRGIVPQANSFKKAKKTVQEKPVEYNAKHLAQRTWEVLTKKSSKSLRDVVYYQRGAMFKNLGTMLFLSFPWMANLAGKAVGVDLGLDFSASYVPYTAYSLYTLWKVYKTRYKDAVPTNPTVLANNLQDLQNSTAVEIAKVPPAELTAEHPVLVTAAKELKSAIDALAFVEARAQKIGSSGLAIKHEKEVGEELKNLLLLAGRTPQEAEAAQTNLQKVFDNMEERNISWFTKWSQAFMMKGMPMALTAMTVATFGELGLSNGLAFAMRELLGKENATTATALVGILLYFCMFAWRAVGNVVSQRMSGGSMYALSSLTGVAGPAMMALAMQNNNMGLLVAGAITACFGISNFFSQMYEYMVGLHPKHVRQIATMVSLTMPVAALPVGIMKSEWFKGFGIPGLDMAVCAAALAASVALTPGMLANSSIVLTVKNYWNKLVNKLKHSSGGEQLPPPAEIPAQ